MRLQWCLICAALLIMSGCASANQPSQVIGRMPTAASREHASDSAPPTVVVSPTLLAQQGTSSASTASTCSVTLPNGSTPPGQEPLAHYHGIGAIWTELEPDGVIRAKPEDVGYNGSVDVKFPWWRGPGVRGSLTITGHRLDGVAPPLRAGIPGGYGDTGFQASGIIFSTEGCWEVTGRAANATLTFVTYVVKEQG
jgi:hypothetical protein